MLLPMALETSLSRPLLEGYGLVLAYDASTASMSSEAGEFLHRRRLKMTQSCQEQEQVPDHRFCRSQMQS